MIWLLFILLQLSWYLNLSIIKIGWNPSVWILFIESNFLIHFNLVETQSNCYDQIYSLILLASLITLIFPLKVCLSLHLITFGESFSFPLSSPNSSFQSPLMFIDIYHVPYHLLLIHLVFVSLPIQPELAA